MCKNLALHLIAERKKNLVRNMKKKTQQKCQFKKDLKNGENNSISSLK